MRFVTLLGAGASTVAGTPTIKEFRDASKRVWQDFSNTWTPNGRSLFHDALRRWDLIHPSANLEEFYVLADLLDQLGGPMPIRSPLDDIVYLIGRTLEHTTTPHKLGSHERFLQAYVLGRPREEHAIVTPNWDSLIERAASRIPGIAIDYGHPKSRSLQPAPVKVPTREVLCLKLHGSFDWLACLRCQTHWLSANTQYVLTLLEGPGQIDCPSCGHDHVRPVVTPPLGEKFTGRPSAVVVLAHMWRRALRILSECHVLEVVGYSFPATDVQLRLLLAKALADNKDLRQISFVTRPKPRAQRKRFESHCRESLGNLPVDPAIDFRYVSFSDWVKSLEEAKENRGRRRHGRHSSTS